jgi:glycosyltransferase involved in cell wall biosynthesis
MAVISKFQQQIPSLKIIRHTHNRGVPAALNTGLAAASGDLVYFAAADDIAFAGLLAAATNNLERYTQAAFFCSTVAVIDEQGQLLGFRPPFPPCLRDGYLSPQAVRRELTRSDNWAVGPSVIYRRSCLQQAGGFDEDLGSFCDAFVIRLLALQHGFCFSNELHAAWQRHPASYSSRTAMSVTKSVALIAAAVEKLGQKYPKDIAEFYGHVLDRRLRFNTARLWLKWGVKPDIDSITTIAGLGKFDHRVLKIFSKIPRYWPTAMLAWITLRLRPVGSTAILRGLFFLTRRLSYSRRFEERWLLVRQSAKQSVGFHAHPVNRRH